MTVPRDVLVVVDDKFDSIYAQVRVRPRVSVSVYVCVSLYDPCVHVLFFYIAAYLGNYSLFLALLIMYMMSLFCSFFSIGFSNGIV